MSISFSICIYPASTSTNPDTHISLWQAEWFVSTGPLTLEPTPHRRGAGPATPCRPPPAPARGAATAAWTAPASPNGWQLLLMLRVPPEFFKGMLKIWKLHHHTAFKWNQEIAIKTSAVKILMIYCKLLQSERERPVPAWVRLVRCGWGQDRCSPALTLFMIQNEGELHTKRSSCLSGNSPIQLHYLQQQRAQKGLQKAARDSPGVFYEVLCWAQLVLEHVSSRRASFSSTGWEIWTRRSPRCSCLTKPTQLTRVD